MVVAESDIIPVEDRLSEFEDFEEVSIDGSCSTTAKFIADEQQQSSSSSSSCDDELQSRLAAQQQQQANDVASVIFMCKTCHIYFPVRRMLETHMSTVHDNATTNRAVNWRRRQRQPQSFVAIRGAKATAGYVKLEDGNYFCRYCDYKAPGRSAVSTHVGRKHGRRRPLLWDSSLPATKPKTPKVAAKEKKKKRKNKEDEEEKKAANNNDDSDTQRSPPPLVHITKVVMTVDNLSATAVEGDGELESPEATTATAEQGIVEQQRQQQVPEALNEEEVVEEGDRVGHARRMCEYSCPYCRYETRKRAEMHAHITEKHNEAWYESVAQQEAEREQLKQRDNYNPEDGRHYCHYCPFSATSRPTLNAHTRRKHKGFMQPYNKATPGKKRRAAAIEFHCDQCDFKSRYRHKIQAHIERKHVAEPRYTCEYCGRKYKTKSDLTSHMRFQHFQQALVCELCGKVCSNSNALHIHRKREHFKPDFECSICKRRMVSQANLDEHVQRQHTDKQHYMCEQCGKVFDQPCKLKQHTMTHTGERPNICHICGKAFARRAVFRQHLLIHSGERPYVCDICGKAFTQKPGLICHRKSHPGDKPPLPVVYIDSILDKFLSKG